MKLFVADQIEPIGTEHSYPKAKEPQLVENAVPMSFPGQQS